MTWGLRHGIIVYHVNETRFFDFREDKPVRICLQSPATYGEASAHLGFHWVWRLLNDHPDVCCDRAFREDVRGRETGRPLGGMFALLYSMPYEIHLYHLIRMLHHLKIPVRWKERGETHPLLIVGGHAGRLLFPLLREVADVVMLGDAEVLSKPLLEAISSTGRLETLDLLSRVGGVCVRGSGKEPIPASMPAGYFREERWLPISAYTTSASVFGRSFLTEVGRGCSQKCKFCYISHAQGRFVPYQKQHLLHLIDRFPSVEKFGFVGAAVGDHPDLEEILEYYAERRKRVSISSIKLTTLRKSVLRRLRSCGEPRLTIAPEAGNAVLRAEMGKPISDEAILDHIEAATAEGFHHIKIYFLLGLPGETREDAGDIAELVRRIRETCRGAEKVTGRPVTLHLSVAPFVPKPFTPWESVLMAKQKDLSERWTLLRKDLGKMPGVKLHGFNLREGLMQYDLLHAVPEKMDEIINSILSGKKELHVSHSP